jgi:hypothetical protein
MNFLEWATYYVRELGWSVFPLAIREKNPITQHGVDDASNDLSQIEKWWGKGQQYNIGLSCEKSDLAIVDLDSPQAMQRWHLILDALGYSNMQTAIVKTAKGEHWYFRQPNTQKMTNTQKGKKHDGTVEIEKIERRGIGGYVVLPPSIHPTGVIYDWMEFHKPNDKIAELPLDLLATIQPPIIRSKVTIPPIPRADGDAERHAQNIVKKLARDLSGTPSGAWHQEILAKGRFVGGLIGARVVDETWAFQVLLKATASRKDTRDSERTLRQALEFGKSYPIYPEAKR